MAKLRTKILQQRTDGLRITDYGLQITDTHTLELFILDLFERWICKVLGMLGPE